MKSSPLFALAIYTSVLFGLLGNIHAIPITWVHFDNYTEIPSVVNRTEWSARSPVARVPMKDTPTPYVVIHHGGTPVYCYDEKACSAIVRSYQNFHMDDHGWFDIGYSFVIGEDGNAYEGRGWDYVGAHAPGYNGQSIGICIIGDFSDFLPNERALKTLKDLIDYGVSIGKISRDYQVLGHRQARNTLCPGTTFYKYVQSLPRWTAKPVPKEVKTSATVTMEMGP